MPKTKNNDFVLLRAEQCVFGKLILFAAKKIEGKSIASEQQ